MIKNPLLDMEFLNELHNHRQREVYARITLLTQNELPIEYIEGRVTAGSISVDGTSALRRTCNLTMILKDKSEINQFDWTFKSKFKLEVGLKNMVNNKYPDIIWFKQGIFILTTCNMNQTTNNYTITINGKDKMCLLNGDLGGNIPHSTDFGVEEYYDIVTGDITYTKVLLKNIIRNALQTFGGELPENIIINDLDEAGLELLEYRSEDFPLYLFRNVEDGQVTQVTMDEMQQVVLVNDREEVKKSLKDLQDSDFVNTSELFESNGLSSAKFYLCDSTVIDKETEYQIIRYKYGDLAGYRLTDLTYAGELKCNVGETLVSVLDKIKKMLSDFEYFYNLDGKFVFQKKRTYISTPWGGVEHDSDNGLNLTLNDAHPKINLMDAQLTTAFANNPNLLNVKNDFSVWGTFKSISGADIPIHMRYALDTKPTKYFPIRSVWTRRADSDESVPPDAYLEYDGNYNDEPWTNENNISMTSSYFDKGFSTDPYEDWIIADWRELIYQMALDYYAHGNEDDFCLRVAAANPQYPTGKTGYEQYYTDISGFWRQLYDPKPDATYEEIAADEAKDELANGESIYIDNYYHKLTKEELFKKKENSEDENVRAYDLKDLYIISTIKVKKSNGDILDKQVFYPFLKSDKCKLTVGTEYWWYTGTGYESSADTDKLNTKYLEALYQKVSPDSDKKILVIEACYDNFVDEYDYSNDKKSFWIKKDDKKILDKDSIEALIYRDGIEGNESYVQFLRRWGMKDNYGNYAMPSDDDDDDIPQEISDRITYLKEYPSGDYLANHWNKAVGESPDQLIFWFDFLETEGSDLYKYSVGRIGSRTKSINDSNVKSIYYRDVPNVIFVTSLADDTYEKKSGYTYIQLPPGYASLFSISGRGKSAKERVDELLQEHSYAIEQTNITTVPLYHLEPNTRVAAKDEMSNVDGEYIVTKVTVPLAYNGTMSLSTTKVVSNII